MCSVHVCMYITGDQNLVSLILRGSLGYIPNVTHPDLSIQQGFSGVYSIYQPPWPRLQSTEEPVVWQWVSELINIMIITIRQACPVYRLSKRLSSIHVFGNIIRELGIFCQDLLYKLGWGNKHVMFQSMGNEGIYIDILIIRNKMGHIYTLPTG